MIAEMISQGLFVLHLGYKKLRRLDNTALPDWLFDAKLAKF